MYPSHDTDGDEVCQDLLDLVDSQEQEGQRSQDQSSQGQRSYGMRSQESKDKERCVTLDLTAVGDLEDGSPGKMLK